MRAGLPARRGPGVDCLLTVCAMGAPPCATDDELEERLFPLPRIEVARDPWFRKTLVVLAEGAPLKAMITEIYVGEVSGDRLYRAEYEDGDLEDFSLEDLECRVVAGAPMSQRGRAVTELAKAGLNMDGAKPPEVVARREPVCGALCDLLWGEPEQPYGVSDEGEPAKVRGYSTRYCDGVVGHPPAEEILACLRERPQVSAGGQKKRRAATPDARRIPISEVENGPVRTPDDGHVPVPIVGADLGLAGTGVALDARCAETRSLTPPCCKHPSG